MNKYDLRNLLALSLPIELAKEITSFMTSSDIKKPNLKEEIDLDYIPNFRVRHRYLKQLMSF